MLNNHMDKTGKLNGDSGCVGFINLMTSINSLSVLASLDAFGLEYLKQTSKLYFVISLALTLRTN